MHESEAQTECSVFLMADIEIQATTALQEALVQTNHEEFQVSSETQVELAYTDEANQHDLPPDQVFEKETDATAETGHDSSTQVETAWEERGVDSCYSEMCSSSGVQAAPILEEKDVQAVVCLEDKEVHAPFCGESHEVQCVVELSECTMQTEILTESQEVQATDFELSINRWALNQVEFNAALQTDSLLKVDACIKQLTSHIEAAPTDSKTSAYEQYC